MNYNIKKNKIIVICLLTVFLFSTLFACSLPEKRTDGFSTDSAYSASQYTMFVNKEITTVTNHLVTQMALGDKVINGSDYPVEDALKSAENSVKVLNECIENVNTMIPPTQYAEDRISVLEALESAKSTLETYCDALKQNPIDTKKIKDLIGIMEADYIHLTSLSNIYWE